MQNKKSNWKTSKKNIKYLLPESRAEGRKKKRRRKCWDPANISCVYVLPAHLHNRKHGDDVKNSVSCFAQKSKMFFRFFTSFDIVKKCGIHKGNPVSILSKQGKFHQKFRWYYNVPSNFLKKWKKRLTSVINYGNICLTIK